MKAFDFVFPDLARQESRCFQVPPGGVLPAGTYVFREFYCDEPRCDCRRVILHVHWVEGEEVAASIGYAFDPPDGTVEDEEQIYLDPLNPQTSKSPTILALFTSMIASDPAYRDRLIRHYELWKNVVDDDSHPQHKKVRTASHQDPHFRPAFPERKPIRRAEPKIGRNAPCPCGSGLKSKNCCRG